MRRVRYGRDIAASASRGSSAIAALEPLEARVLMTTTTFDVRNFFLGDPRDTATLSTPTGTTPIFNEVLTYTQPEDPNSGLRSQLFTITGSTNNPSSTLNQVFTVDAAGLTYETETWNDPQNLTGAAKANGLVGTATYSGSGTNGGLTILPALIQAGQTYTYSGSISGSEQAPILDTWTGSVSGSVQVDGMVQLSTNSAGNYNALELEWTENITQTGTLGWTGTSTIKRFLFLARKVGVVGYSYEQQEDNNDGLPIDESFSASLTDNSLLHTFPGITVTGNGQVIAFRNPTQAAANNTAFGQVAVGATQDRTFTITNTTAYPLSLSPLIGNHFQVDSSGPAAAEFQVVSTGTWNLAAGASTSFTVAFTPTTTGPQFADIDIPSGQTGVTPFDFVVRGTGVAYGNLGVTGPTGAAINNGAAPLISLGTRFGTDAAGTGSYVDRTFTLTNSGSGTLDLTEPGGVLVTGNPSAFKIIGFSTTELAPGQTVSLTIRFKPFAAGLKKATITLTTNSPTTATISFGVTGTGV